MTYHLAQINIARMLAPIEHPIMADFVNNLDRINTLAEKSPGFIWRLKDENDNFVIINMSMWKDRKALFDFTYRSGHTDILKRKKEWFEKMMDMHMALWYVKEKHFPTPEEAKERLNYLNFHGDSPYAFTFRSEFAPEDVLNYKTRPR